MPKDSILIIGGGLLQVPAVESAHSLGLRAIVTDRNLDAPALRLADEGHAIDIYNVSGHVDLARALSVREHLVGVFTEGADCEVTVASVAAALGLPGVSIEAAIRCKNKSWMRQCFEEANISSIKWRTAENLENAFYFKSDLDWPVIVKATDNCGSRGVHVVNDAAKFSVAIADAIANGTTKTALIEEFLTGPQQSVEILFDATGKCHWLNVVDRYFDGVMELGHVNPSRLFETNHGLDAIALFEMTEASAKAVGVNFGAFKADTIWTDSGPRILEVTARLSGGFDCQYTTPLATGRNFIRAAMKLAVGRNDIDEDLIPTRQRWSAAWAAFPKPGWVTSLPDYVVQAGGGPWLGMDGSTTIFRVKVGDIIEPYENCAQRPGFVIAVGDTYDAAMNNAKHGAEAMTERIITE
jgi:biotin carboxylase